MNRPRKRQDGLPFRVYCETGKRKVSYYYKHHDGTREALSDARLVDRDACAEARRIAIRRGVEINEGTPAQNNVATLFAEYFAWQRGLPMSDERRKAESTLVENVREAKTLLSVFGEMSPEEITAPDLYQYQDLRVQAGAGPKANKELALMSAVLEFGRARGRVQQNIARGIKRVPTRPKTRCVTYDEIMAVREVAQESPSWTIQALAAAAAWLCVRRPPEILSLRLVAVELKGDGVRFIGAKRKAGMPERSVLIRWSPALREVFESALSIKRNKVAGSFYVFGNLAGQRYSKSGWGTMWGRLMERCAERIDGFQPFSLLDCRAGGVTAKKERGDLDTQDATLHEDGRMIEKTYDRRKDRTADPAG